MKLRSLYSEIILDKEPRYVKISDNGEMELNEGERREALVGSSKDDAM